MGGKKRRGKGREAFRRKEQKEGGGEGLRRKEEKEFSGGVRIEIRKRYGMEINIAIVMKVMVGMIAIVVVMVILVIFAL